MTGRQTGYLAACAGAALALFLGVEEAQATSVYGCENLQNAGIWASVEGRDGVFFRVDPDLYNYHPLTDETIAVVSDLSEALTAKGTTLVLAPIPTKALAMPHLVGHDADLFSHDGDIAATVYLDGLRRLADAKLVTAEPYDAMVRAAEKSFFDTDPRLTASGGQIMAQAIGDKIRATGKYDGFATHRFVSEPNGPKPVFSSMRFALQQHCALPLPQAETQTFVTRLDQAASGTVGVIALVGTEYSDLPETNFAGFLAEATGLDVIQYSLPGGGAFGAISTYLTSREFQSQRPDYLVWEYPVDENLGAKGLQPLEELIAAARGACRSELTLRTNAENTTKAQARLESVDFGQHDALLLDLGPVPARVARFAFRTEDGLARTRVIARHPDQVQTGRFFVPLTGLWSGGASQVDITVDLPLDTEPQLLACGGEDK